MFISFNSLLAEMDTVTMFKESREDNYEGYESINSNADLFNNTEEGDAADNVPG